MKFRSYVVGAFLIILSLIILGYAKSIPSVDDLAFKAMLALSFFVMTLGFVSFIS